MAQNGRLPTAFMTSAPGKVIVFGEHAVVYGKAAIAAAISLRSYLLITPDKSSTVPITLTFPDIGLAHVWPLDSLPWKAFAAREAPINDPIITLDQSLVDILQPHLQPISPTASDATRKIHQAAAKAFLYILLSVCRGRPPSSHTFIMRSTIPIAAGLGSSASISVCIAAALLTLTGDLPPPTASPSAETLEANLHLINNWAFVGELCIHGNPSGVDNTVATRGRAVLFKRMKPGQPPSVKPLDKFPVLPLLLVDTKQSRSTATEVAKVRTLMDKYPDLTEPILDAIGLITATAYEMFSEESGDPHRSFIDELGTLIRMNHGLLVSLGVSHPRLERIRELIDHAGIGYTKLTGAGGGGCAISVLKHESGEGLAELEKQLEGEGFAKYTTLLGGHGVAILNTTGEASSVPNQADFLSAKSSQDIEELVGVSDKIRGWQYWD